MSTPTDPPTPPDRVSIRDIAKSVGVSIMTVSLSLRQNPKISEATRRRVQQAAARLGYRPDPEIARLMTRLHNRRHAGDAPPMAIVDLSPVRLPPQVAHNDYCERARLGATARAESLGYIASHFHRLDYDGDTARLLKVLNYRGIRGVLLLPPVQPIELDPRLNWAPFSVIAATYAITPLHFHRVVPHQFIDMCRLIKQLEARGHRRIGAVFDTQFEERIHYHFTAAITLHNYGQNILRVPDPKNLRPDQIREWLEFMRPDALVCPFALDLRRAIDAIPDLTVPRPLLVSLGAVKDPTMPYWDERPEDIGADAASILAGMIQHNETGVPDSPRTSMIHGVFHDTPAQAQTAEAAAVAPAPRTRSGRAAAGRKQGLTPGAA